MEIKEEDLGQWRRTHYSSEVNPSMADREVVVMGWVASVRDHGNIQFIIIKDSQGEMQVTAKKSDVGEELFAIAKAVKEHTSLGVRGKIRPQEKAPNGTEIVPAEIRAFSVAKKAAPFMTQGKTSPVGIDTRLDLRAVDLRRNQLGSIFRIRQTV
ncbi:MAG: OB-fold nucleic acid binding domain-containing protein, partial [Nitrososphaera sp.]